MSELVLAETVYVDANGLRWSGGNHVGTSAGGVLLRRALAQCSELAIESRTEQQEWLLPAVEGRPGTGAYATARDCAVLMFASAGGNVRITVPGPLGSCFSGDAKTVDPDDPGMAAVIAAALEHVYSGSGNVVTRFVSGRRTRSWARGDL